MKMKLQSCLGLLLQNKLNNSLRFRIMEDNSLKALKKNIQDKAASKQLFDKDSYNWQKKIGSEHLNKIICELYKEDDFEQFAKDIQGIKTTYQKEAAEWDKKHKEELLNNPELVLNNALVQKESQIRQLLKYAVIWLSIKYFGIEELAAYRAVNEFSLLHQLEVDYLSDDYKYSPSIAMGFDTLLSVKKKIEKSSRITIKYEAKDNIGIKPDKIQEGALDILSFILHRFYVNSFLNNPEIESEHNQGTKYNPKQFFLSRYSALIPQTATKNKRYCFIYDLGVLCGIFKYVVENKIKSNSVQYFLNKPQ